MNNRSKGLSFAALVVLGGLVLFTLNNKEGTFPAPWGVGNLYRESAVLSSCCLKGRIHDL